MQRNGKMIVISLLVFLLASALGKWLVFEAVLSDHDTGRQRIETDSKINK